MNQILPTQTDFKIIELPATQPVPLTDLHASALDALARAIAQAIRERRAVDAIAERKERCKETPYSC